MRKMGKRVIALILSVMMAYSGIPMQNVYAMGDTYQTKKQASQDNTEKSTEETVQENNEESTKEAQKDIESTENSAEVEGTQELSEDGVDEITEILIDYVAVGQPYVQIPGTQKIVVGISNSVALLENVSLKVRNQQTQEEEVIPASQIENETLVFEKEYTQDSESGEYTIEGMSYGSEGNEAYIGFSEIGVEAKYGVNCEVETAPDAYTVDEEQSIEGDVSKNIVTFNDDGTTQQQNSIPEAIEAAREESAASADGIGSMQKAANNGNIVVVLDPGHDDTHKGASGNGREEEKLTLKIAQYCKAELEKYQGVTVYMTRNDSGACPYPGTSSSDCNANRVAYAKSVGANVFVSIHLNSASPAASGVEVYYPNSNYNANVGAQGGALASKVLEQLVALGLNNRGTKIHNSEDNTQYPDGSLADYYGVIRRSKLAGFPAIIIEHAFLSNTSDVANHLSSEAQLQALGVADATGIAQYYGLSTEEEYAYGSANLYVCQEPMQMHYQAVAENIPNAASVYFAVWGEENGQNDLKWYTAQKDAQGRWSADIQVLNHREGGKYQVHVYIGRRNMTQYKVGEISFKVDSPTASGISIENENASVGTFRVKLNGVTAKSGIYETSIAVWSQSDQSDLYWYKAVKQSDGSYIADVNIANHKYNYGTYNVKAYVTAVNGVKTCVAATTKTLVSNVSVKSEVKNSEYGYQITATNVPYGNGVKNVRFAVWGEENGQNDKKWYSGTKQSDGSWTAYVNLTTHREAGTYQVHTYVDLVNGSSKLVKCTTFNVSVPSATGISIENKNVAGNFDVRVKGASAASGIYQVRVAAWTQADQSDLKWYNVTKQSDGSYVVHVDIANHKNNYGTYQIHAYATAGNGVVRLVQNTTVNISSNVSVKSEVRDNEYGYQITAKDVPYGTSLKGIRFAVWGEENGQNDKKWYSGTKQSDGSWTAYVNLTTHREAGTYQVHTYADLKDGSSKLIKCTTFSVSVPFATGISVENKNETNGTYDVRLTGANAKSGIYQVRVAAWTQSDQSDLKWYNAVKQSDGSYVVHVDIANHKNNYGTYQIHAYATAGNGVVRLVQQTTTNISSNVSVKSEVRDNEYGYQITAKDVPYGTSLKGIRFAVWGEENGQNDKKWYSGTKQSDGSWTAYVNLTTHREAGTYQVHTYADLKDGSSKLIKCTTFSVSVPTATGISVENANGADGTYDVRLTGANAKSGIYQVRVAAWTQSNQSDLKWYIATRQSDGSYLAHIDIQNHNYNTGTYNIHAYAKAGNGVERLVQQMTTNFKVNSPKAGISPNSNKTIYTVKVKDVPLTNNMYKLKIAVWSEANDQKDLKWYEMTKIEPTAWAREIQISQFKVAGKYNVHVYGEMRGNVNKLLACYTFNVEGVSASSVSITNQNEANGTFEVRIKGLKAGAPMTELKVPVWSAADKSDIKWYKPTKVTDSEYVVYVDVQNHNKNLGKYTAHIYANDMNEITSFVGQTSCNMLNVTNTFYNIVGSTAVTRDQMVAYYNANQVYPAFYQNSDAPTIEAFCQIYIEECTAEGIKAEIAFSQAMKETGFLRYGGDVNIAQFNFAGLGATGGGNPGNSFSSVREGVRAQVQHLKAYASTEPLNNACVDPRFQYVTRGTAPYVEWLGQKENPNGYGWATAQNYGYSIKNDYIAKLITY